MTMPEGVEVRLFAEFFAESFAKSILTSIEIVSGRYQRSPIRGLKEIQSSLPLSVDNVSVAGKFMWVKLANNYMMLTFGLTGGWSLSDHPHNRIKFTFNRGDKEVYLYLKDMRNFATVKFGELSNVNEKLNKLGIDMFSCKFTVKYFMDKLRKNGSQCIAESLLNQKVVAGPGTYIIAETLYKSKISPGRKNNSLSDTDIQNIFIALSQVIKESYESNRYYVKNNNPADKKFKFKVYGKTMDDHGNPVERFKVLTRNIKWVPAIQI